MLCQRQVIDSLSPDNQLIFQLPGEDDRMNRKRNVSIINSRPRLNSLLRIIMGNDEIFTRVMKYLTRIFLEREMFPAEIRRYL